MRLKEALDAKPGEVISLVGGGGKTTLMFALAHELAGNGNCVITTTTTRIREPSSSETQLLLVEKDDAKMLRLLLENMADYRHITLASEELAPKKLKGISPELVARLTGLEQVAYVIVEADGAARRSLKAPNQTEPVIPTNTSLVIPVVGIDVLGCRLTEEVVFRPEIASRLLGMSIGEVISAEAIAFLITHPQGIIKGSPEQARVVPFLNKTDLDDGLKKGREIAREILRVGHPRIDRIILGQAQFPEPVVEVITRR